MKVTPTENYSDSNGYFNLPKFDISKIKLLEKKDESSCYLQDDAGAFCKGFKITDNPKVNTYCEFTFFRSSKTGKYLPRPTFLKIDEKFQQKEQTIKEKVRIDMSDHAEVFWKVIGFLHQYKEIVDLGEFEKSYSVVNKDRYMVEFESKDRAEKIKDLQEFTSKIPNFSDFDMQFFLKQSREKNLKTFAQLIKNADLWKKYYEKFKSEVKKEGEEYVWHYFLKRHHWLLGLNADLRFIRDFIDEADIGIKNTESKGSPQVDMLGLNDYTMLVELKTPNTKIFTDVNGKTGRAGTWSFSQAFIDGVSQCLAQKTKWQESYKNKDIKDVKGNLVDKNKCRTVDPRALFIIGNKSIEFSEDVTREDIITKRDTFENFRRNNRNLEIITYDELYERAYFIVHNKRP